MPRCSCVLDSIRGYNILLHHYCSRRVVKKGTLSIREAGWAGSENSESDLGGWGDSVKEARGIEGLGLDEGDGAMLSAFIETFRH